MTQKILTTCPRDCYDACGVVVGRNRDGSLQVRGAPQHAVGRGWLCGKCAAAYNGILMDPRQRLARPLRRSGPKGSGSFTPVSWDEALDEVAGRLGPLISAGESRTIVNTHYTGTTSLLAYHYPMRFFNRIGATEVDPDSICNRAGHVALSYVYGTSVHGFDPRTVGDAACVLVWGANPSSSAPHADRHWLGEAAATVIVVDPVSTPTAARAAIHLQPFPGSDAALAFALMHVIRREGLADLAFLSRHATGWPEMEPLLEPCTPEWGEAVTGVPAARIVEAARIYGRGPSLLWLGQGFQRQRTGGNALRACSLLPALSGNLGRPGTGFLYLNGPTADENYDYLCASHLALDPPEPISQMDLAPTLEDPARSRALFCWNINIAVSNPQQSRLRRALQRDDLFTVVVDLFQTDTADYADVILPAAGFLEFDDLVCAYFHLEIGAQVRATDPLGESLPNPEIFRRLAARMGLEEPELYEPDSQVIARVLQSTGLGLDFQTLARSGSLSLHARPRIQFADLRFPTPSGKVEIASAAAESDGLPRLPQPTCEPRPAEGRLRLLSPGADWLLNGSFANDPTVTRHLGTAIAWLHPQDAAERGIGEGDPVVLENAEGCVEVEARIAALVPPGVVLSVKGRWPKREASSANVNFLNPGQKSDMGAATSVHGVEVEVKRRAGAAAATS